MLLIFEIFHNYCNGLAPIGIIYKHYSKISKLGFKLATTIPIDEKVMNLIHQVYNLSNIYCGNIACT